jgi:hypothetical protein
MNLLEIRNGWLALSDDSSLYLKFILITSRVLVTIHGVPIGNWIY